MSEFVHDHVNKEYVVVVERVFPNMGGDVNKQQAGTITELVRPRKSSHIVLYSVVGSAMVLSIIAVAVLVYRARVKVEPKKAPEPML